MDWGSYESVEPGVDRPLSEVTRKEAVAAFTIAMELKDHRISTVRQLLQLNGLVLTSDHPGLVRLMTFMSQEVSFDPEFPGDLDHGWHAVLYDLGLWLGDALIARVPTLSWGLLKKPKSEVDYQSHVVMSPQGGYFCNPERYLVGLSYALLEGGPEREERKLPTWFELNVKFAEQCG